MPLVLYERQSKPYDIAQQHSPADNESSIIDKYLPDGLAARAHGLENTYRGRLFQNKYQQSADYSQAGQYGHQRNDNQDIKVKKFQPIEYLWV